MQTADGQERGTGDGSRITNEFSGTVGGSVVQIGTATGPVTVVHHAAPAEHDVLTGTAEKLAKAVATRYREGEEHQQIQDPFPLALRWRPAPVELTDHWDSINPSGRRGAEVLPDLSGELDQVLALYRRVPSGRLVVLGRAGAGKTVLAMRIALDLLAARATGAAVPVILGLASWNPVTTPFRDWLATRLAREHPGLSAPGPDGSTLAVALVEAGLVLPVLDGFDEIADGLHRPALASLNRASRMPLLVTSRRDEYEAAVTGTDVLTAAAVIELTDLTLDDLADYLPLTTRRTARPATRAGAVGAGAAPDEGAAKAGPPAAVPVWEPVLARLRAHDRSRTATALAEVLTTPLMVALARIVYSDTPDHQPSDLLDADRFGTREDLEVHLLDTFVPTVYGPGTPSSGRRRDWNPEQALRWLGQLALHMDRLGTRDLAWWELGTTLRGATRATLVGTLAGLVLGTVAGLSGLLTDGAPEALFALLMNGLGGGLAFGFVHWVVPWGLNRFPSARPVFEPARVQLRIRGRSGRVRDTLLARLLVGVFCGAVFGLTVGIGSLALLGTVLHIRGNAGVLYALALWIGNWLVIGLSLGLMGGLVNGLLARFEVPIDLRTSVSPADLLRADRATVLVQLLVVGLVVGAGYGGLIALRETTDKAVQHGVVGAIGVAVAYGLSLSAWGRWVVLVRIWLPLTGRLPWAVAAFLDDAHHRGVLRQAGAVYQFRHARLQERLAATAARR
ncbi:NACHT domain-containing protein [Kitasatospora sp. NPDC003701]